MANEINEGEIERERLEEFAEMDIKIQTVAPGTSLCHEALDRTSVIADNIQQHLVEHPAIVASPEFYRLARIAAGALSALYQAIGAVHLKDSAND